MGNFAQLYLRNGKSYKKCPVCLPLVYNDANIPLSMLNSLVWWHLVLLPQLHTFQYHSTICAA